MTPSGVEKQPRDAWKIGRDDLLEADLKALAATARDPNHNDAYFCLL